MKEKIWACFNLAALIYWFTDLFYLEPRRRKRIQAEWKAFEDQAVENIVKRVRAIRAEVQSQDVTVFMQGKDTVN